MFHKYFLLFHMFAFTLTLDLLEQNMISQCATSIEAGQHTHLCSLTRFYSVGWPAANLHLDIPKVDNGQIQNGRWTCPFKKFSRLRVKEVNVLSMLSTTDQDI